MQDNERDRQIVKPDDTSTSQNNSTSQDQPIDPVTEENPPPLPPRPVKTTDPTAPGDSSTEETPPPLPPRPANKTPSDEQPKNKPSPPPVPSTANRPKLEDIDPSVKAARGGDSKGVSGGSKDTSTNSSDGGSSSGKPAAGGIASDSPTRAEDLKKKYVTDFIQKKESEQNEEESLTGKRRMNAEATPEQEDNSRLGKVLGGLDKVADKADDFGFVNDIIGDTGAMIGNGTSIANKYLGGGDGSTFDNADKGLNSSIGVVTGGIDLGFGALSLYKNSREAHKARKGNNRIDKWKAGFGTAGATLGVMGSAANIASAGLGLGSLSAGMKGNDKLSDGLGDAGDYAGYAGGALQIAGGLTSMIGSSIESGMNRSARNKTKRISESVTDQKMKDSKSALENARKMEAKNETEKAAKKDAILKARTARSTAKAQKYAMAYASQAANRRMRKSKYDAIGGALGTLGGGASLGSGIMGNLLKSKGGAWGALGLTGLGLGLKLAGTLTSKLGGSRHDKLEKQDHDKVIADYIKAKASKIRTEGSGDQVTENEAKKIAIARLGIDLTIDNEQNVNDDQMKKAFNKLMYKRARNIMESDGDSKKAMLNAMKLNEGATIDEVAKALGAD